MIVRKIPSQSHGFVDFLAGRNVITPEQAQSLRRRLTAPENWIGRLMVSHALIGQQHIDEILNRQDIYGGLFGENAVALGYLTQAQLDALLVAQEARRNMDAIEALAIGGHLDVREGLRLICEYLLASDKTKVVEKRAASASLRAPREPGERGTRRTPSALCAD